MESLALLGPGLITTACKIKSRKWIANWQVEQKQQGHGRGEKQIGAPSGSSIKRCFPSVGSVDRTHQRSHGCLGWGCSTLLDIGQDSFSPHETQLVRIPLCYEVEIVRFVPSVRSPQAARGTWLVDLLTRILPPHTAQVGWSGRGLASTGPIMESRPRNYQRSRTFGISSLFLLNLQFYYLGSNHQRLVPESIVPSP